MEEELNTRILHLALGRVIKKVYISLPKSHQDDMEKIFISLDENAKAQFVKKYMPDFKQMFQEALQEITKEIELELPLQV